MNDFAALAWPIRLATLRVRERPSPLCILRVRRMDVTLSASLGREFDVTWPLQPNSASAAPHGVCVLWTGPCEWTILDLPPALVCERVKRACGAALHHLADVSDGRAGFEISGPLTRDLMAKGCSLDLHPRAFGPGTCAQTLLADVPVLLYYPRADVEPCLRVYADTSLSAHLRSWFQDAVLEFTADV